MTKKLSFWFLISSIILSLLLAGATFTFREFLPLKLPLFYSLPWGQGQLSTHRQFLIIPATITLITLLNYTIASQLHESQKFFKKMLFFSSFLTSLILMITYIKIVMMFI